MPIYRTYKQGNLTVGVWKVDETVEQLRSMFHQFSIYEEAFTRFSSDKRKQEWLAVRVLLKELCGGEEKEIDDFFAYCGLLTENSNELKQEKLRRTAATLAEIAVNMKNSPDKQEEYLHLDELSRRILAAAQ